MRLLKRKLIKTPLTEVFKWKPALAHRLCSEVQASGQRHRQHHRSRCTRHAILHARRSSGRQPRSRSRLHRPPGRRHIQEDREISLSRLSTTQQARMKRWSPEPRPPLHPCFFWLRRVYLNVISTNRNSDTADKTIAKNLYISRPFLGRSSAFMAKKRYFSARKVPLFSSRSTAFS